MILNDYYLFERLPGCKSKTRLDCQTSSHSYPEFEALRNRMGELFLYFPDVPDHFKADVKRKADKILSNRFGKSVSSVFVPNITLPFGFGDMKNTNDALLMVFSDDFLKIEVFVARGQRNNRISLYNLLTDGELSEEMEYLRKQAGNDFSNQKKT